MDFEEKQNRKNLFISDLQKLMIKHKVDLAEAEQYDGEENSVGTSFYLSFDAEIWHVQELHEIFKEAMETLNHSK